jgi:hypothetical protein
MWYQMFTLLSVINRIISKYQPNAPLFGVEIRYVFLIFIYLKMKENVHILIFFIKKIRGSNTIHTWHMHFIKVFWFEENNLG